MWKQQLENRDSSSPERSLEQSVNTWKYFSDLFLDYKVAGSKMFQIISFN